MSDDAGPWPDLPLNAWRDTFDTLHRWMQIVGKIRLAKTPWTNHSWHVPLYLTVRGLTTSPIPDGDRTFQIDFDFIAHQLEIRTSEGAGRTMALRPLAVSAFKHELFDALQGLGIAVDIHGRPNEIEDAIPFAQDHLHASYDADYANRLWRVLAQSDRVMKRFRARFRGKCSPVHFFWGSFDLAVTRFSGRPAPPHPGGVPNLPDWVVREAYSHEVASSGFWPGGGPHPFPLFYSYAYPEPDGYAQAKVAPGTAFYSAALREFVLPYDDVRMASSPDDALIAFLQTTYEAAAAAGGWDRSALEMDDPA